MLKNIIIFFAAVVIMAACKSKSNEALKYNQYIVAKQQSFQEEGQEAEDNFSRYYNSGHYDSIAITGAKMESILQKVIDDVKAKTVPDAKGIDEFKEAAITYFEFHRKYYSDCREYGQAENEEKRNEVMTRIETFRSDAQKAEDKIHQAQQKFADANGFRMNKR